MVYVDLALLDLIEGLCRRFQILTGRTNVWLAFQLTNLSIVVYFIWAGVYFWTIPGLARVALALFCAGVLSLLTQKRHLGSCSLLGTQQRRGGDRGPQHNQERRTDFGCGSLDEPSRD